MYSTVYTIELVYKAIDYLNKQGMQVCLSNCYKPDERNSQVPNMVKTLNI